MKNRICEFRRKAEFTQSQLSEKTRISRSRLQRIEAGVESVRADHALRICATLEVTLDTVFPTTRGVLERFAHTGKSCWELLDDKECREQLEAVGMDTDPLHWTFRYCLKGRVEGAVAVSGRDKRRLCSAVQSLTCDASEFVVFDGDGERIVLNLKHLELCRFLFERADNVNDEEDGNCTQQLRLFLAGDKEPHGFEVEPDDKKIDINLADSKDEPGAQTQTLLHAIEGAHGNDQVLSFEDIDGERIFFRRESVALMTVPLICVEPALLYTVVQEEGEGQ